MRLVRALPLLGFASALALACGSSGKQANTDGSGGAGSGGTGTGGTGSGGATAGPTWSASGLNGSIVTSIAVDQANPSTIFLGLSAGGAEMGLWRSKDRGASWSKVGGGLPDRYYGFVTICPMSGTVLANPGVEGVWHSTDGGDNWTQSTSSLTDPGGTNGLFCHPTSGVVWTLSSQQGVFRSNDQGASFVHTPNTNLPLNQFILGPLGFDGTKLYLGTDGHGVYVSTDGGDSWTQAASAGIPTTGATGSIVSLAVTPSRPGVLFAKTNGALFRSLDGAASFTALMPGGAGVRYAALRLDPAHTSTIYVSANETQGGLGGLFESTDDGQTWTNIGPATEAINVLDIAPDGTLYAGTIGNGIWRFGQ